MLILLLGFEIGFFQGGSVMILTSLPIFLNTYLASTAWHGACCEPRVRRVVPCRVHG